LAGDRRLTSAPNGVGQEGKKPTKKPRNRGQFRPGDARINRLGRGLKRVPSLAERVKAWDRRGPCPACAQTPPPKTGRIATLFANEERLRRALSSGYQDSYSLDLPDDARIIAFEPALARAGFVLTLYSERFTPVQAGQPIPELAWQLPGQQSKWRR
jgi:hypothetical protein